jgi:hypothetical protein
VLDFFGTHGGRNAQMQIGMDAKRKQGQYRYLDNPEYTYGDQHFPVVGRQFDCLWPIDDQQPAG